MVISSLNLENMPSGGVPPWDHPDIEDILVYQAIREGDIGFLRAAIQGGLDVNSPISNKY